MACWVSKLLKDHKPWILYSEEEKKNVKNRGWGWDIPNPFF